MWNVHRKNGTERPPHEWVVVPDAHQALISEEAGQAIVAVRRQRASLTVAARNAACRTDGSRYLLTGGLFTCGRCGANLVGVRRRNGKGTLSDYYVCGTAKYRRGIGCGQGVYVDKRMVEGEVVEHVHQMACAALDPARLAKLVDRELRELTAASSFEAVQARERLVQLDRQLDNVRQAIENGLDDVQWANRRVAELRAERDAVLLRAASPAEVIAPPRLPASELLALRAEALRGLNAETSKARRDVVRQFASQIVLEPGTREIQLHLRQVPAQVSQRMVAGAGFEPATYGL